jgi:hypothetical protein
LSVTLREPLRLPVEVIEVDGLPKVIAGNVPVTPINMVLGWKVENNGATRASINTYARAGRLFSEFGAHRGRALIDVTDVEFMWFVRALQGHHFLGSNNHQQLLNARLGARTANLMVALLYSIATDLQYLYGVKLDWYKYRGVPNELVEIVRATASGRKRAGMFRRTHRVPFTPRKIMPLPHEEFKNLLSAAKDRWGNTIEDGDTANAENPEQQRGDLFCRNVGILFSMRYGGARRSD